MKAITKSLENELTTVNRNEQNLRDNCIMRHKYDSDLANYVKLTQYTELREFLSSNFTRDELMNRLRGIDAELFSRAVDTLVSRLRHKLKDTSKTPRFIKTVWGRGYTFVGEQI